MVTIFVSTTDLNHHREQVMSTVHDMGMRAIQQHDEDVSVQLMGRCDVFIAIVGANYGEIPPGDDRSLIEQEYNRACLLGKPRLIYIYETAKADADRSRFVERLHGREVYSVFITPQDLARQVEFDLIRLFERQKMDRRLIRIVGTVALILMLLIVLILGVIANLPSDRRDTFLYNGGLIPPPTTTTISQ